jgi:hypothetical protein
MNSLVRRIVEKINAYKIFIRALKEGDNLDELGVRERIILNCVTQNCEVADYI